MEQTEEWIERHLARVIPPLGRLDPLDASFYLDQRALAVNFQESLRKEVEARNAFYVARDIAAIQEGQQIGSDGSSDLLRGGIAWDKISKPLDRRADAHAASVLERRFARAGNVAVDVAGRTTRHGVMIN